MKKFLILQMRPENKTADSEFEAILRVGGLGRDEVHRIRLEQGIPTINIDDFTAIIAGGSPFDVCIPQENKSQIQKDIEAFYKQLFDHLTQGEKSLTEGAPATDNPNQYIYDDMSKKYDAAKLKTNNAYNELSKYADKNDIPFNRDSFDDAIDSSLKEITPKR